MLRDIFYVASTPPSQGVLPNTAHSPPREEGWMRGHENIAKRPCSAQTGWSKTTQTRIPKNFGKLTIPSAPLW